ncbi:MAG: NADH-quinone oxidoreductase subunit NuoF [Gaiellaceae bacterium MAG52_C11]|nr:NADH-quinone oxidoreductase subunit NuoF [Candidatus Gaiellasilicea maunaloa]
MAEQRLVVLQGADERDLTKLAEYRAIGGYDALAKARALTPQAVIDELLASNLRGRGGAFFATGRKWSFIPKPDQNPNPHYLVVNADESEPGSFKDNEILSRVPHRFIEGCLITAHAVESKHVFVYIRGEYLGPFEAVRDALEEIREDDQLLGGVTIVVHRGAGAYICGEETALLESLEGKRGQPRSKPPFPAISGLYASPTVVNNVETLATVPPIVAMGGAAYAKLGVESSTGTRVVSLSGNLVRGGNYEVAHGITLRELIYDLGGGVPDGRELKAVIPGGSSTVILTAEEIDVPYDYDALAEVGTAMGSAGVIAIDDRCCMVQLGIRVSEFYEHESCGKCTPCREGTRWMTAILRKLEAGEASDSELDLLLDVCDRINGKCLCPLGETAAMAVASYVLKFRDEFLAHLDGGCPFGSQSPLDGVVAPVNQHTQSPVAEVPA